MNKISDTTLVNDIKNVAKKLRASSLSRSEYLKHGQFSMYQIYDGGRTWDDLCDIANIASKTNKPIPDEVYFQRLSDAVRELGRLPKTSERKKYGLSFSKRRYPTLRAFIERAIQLGKIESSVAQISPKTGTRSKTSRLILKSRKPDGLFVDPARIKELGAINSNEFDLTKLIRLCEEINACYSNESYLAVAMITRAIIDHVPPVFGFTTFVEVVNNYQGTKSFKALMGNLHNSSRRIADAHLHTIIRSRETLPNRTQVNFAREVDVLLAEIVRVLK